MRVQGTRLHLCYTAKLTLLDVKFSFRAEILWMC